MFSYSNLQVACYIYIIKNNVTNNNEVMEFVEFEQ